MTDGPTSESAAPNTTPRTSPSGLLIPLAAGLGCLALAAALVFRSTRPAPATLRIESEPSGATVFLNNEFHGTTPVELDRLHPGGHLLRLTLHHHRTWQHQLELTEGDNSVTAELLYRQGGKLAVKSDPPGATVYVDGDPKGLTPLVVTDLDGGIHPLRLVLPDYVEWETRQQVHPGRTMRLHAKLVSRMENFLIRATQADPDQASLWTQLFHFYAINSEYDKAADALANALGAVIREPARNSTNQKRLEQQIGRIWSGTAEIDYGPDDEINKGRKCIESGFERALSLHPDRPELYARLVEFYSQRAGNVEKGNALLEKGLALFPNNRNWYFQSARRGARRRRGSDAVKFYQNKLKKNPNDLIARMRLVTTMEGEGMLDEAIAQYQGLLDRLKTSQVRFALFQSLGALLKRRGRTDEAVTAYEKALKEKAEPKYRAAVLYHIVRIKRDAGDIDGVVSTWEKAIAVQPDVEYACRWRLALARLCVEHDRPAKARQICEDILRISKTESTRQTTQKLLNNLPKS